MPAARRDRLALVDEAVDEVAEVARSRPPARSGVVREPRERGDRIHGRVEDELRPLRRSQVGKRLRLQAGRDDRVGDLLHLLEGRVLVRPEPCLRVEDVLDLGVRVLRPAHERDARDDRPGRRALARRPRRRSRSGRSRPSRPESAPRERRRRTRGPTPSSRRSRRRTSGSCAGSWAAVTLAWCSTLARHAQALTIQGVGVLRPSGQHRDLADAGEMTREEAPDHPRADDADPFHAARRVSPETDMSVN